MDPDGRAIIIQLKTSCSHEQSNLGIVRYWHKADRIFFDETLWPQLLPQTTCTAAFLRYGSSL